MESRIAGALRLKYPPIAVSWTEAKPEGAMEFVDGRFGCVMAALAAVAEERKSAVFGRGTTGCIGGAVGLGFGNAYEKFIGGVECFHRFLSTGNEGWEKGRKAAAAAGGALRGEMREHFLHGEGYRKSPELVESFIRDMPIKDIPASYVTFRPLAEVEEGEAPKVVVLLANADQVSALVVLANYRRESNENAIIPHAAGCQSIGIYAYREAEAWRPRIVVGLNDLSARKNIRRLGKDLMTVAVPFGFFREMEDDVEGSFLEGPTWRSLLAD
jgi:uncharacterized protein (DUF169 family)